MISLDGWIALALGLAVFAVLIRTVHLLHQDKRKAGFHAGNNHDNSNVTAPPRREALNEIELACLRTLRAVVGDELQVRSKVPVSSLLNKQFQHKYAALGEHQLQYLDFVLFHPTRTSAKAAVQLRQPPPEQHARLYALLNKSGIRVFELRRKSSYSVASVRQLLQPLLQHTQPSPDELAATISMQAFRLCQQCESPMVLKRANSGKHQGTLFWVCSKYPECRFVELYKE